MKIESVNGQHMGSKLFFSSFIVFFLSTLTSSLGMIVDGIVIGNTMNVQAVAAYGLISPLNFIFALIGSMLNSGSTNMCAHALGQNDTDEARVIFSMTSYVGLFISLTTAILIGVFVNPILIFLGAEPTTAMFLEAKGYLLAYIIGLPAITGSKILLSIMQLDSDPARAVNSVALMTVVNVVGDLICVKFFHSNLVAIAAVTSISYYAGAFFLLLHFTKKNIIFRYVLRGLDWSKLPKIFRRGMPKAMSRVTNTFSGIYINHLLVAVSTTAVAGFSVFTSTKFILNAVIYGVAQAMMVLISVYYGEENKNEMFKIMTIAMKYQVVLGLVLTAVMYFSANFLTVIYLGSNVDAYPLAITALRWGALNTVFIGINVLFADYLQATRRIRQSNIVYILEEVVFLVASVSVISRKGSGESIFEGLFLSHLLMTIAIPMMISIINKKRISSVDDVLMLGDDFGVEPENELSIEVNSMEDVITASTITSDFFRYKDIPPRNKYLISLAVEEMGTNIIKYGFSDNKAHLLTIRIFRKGDDITLIFRDNCGYFDPVERYNYLKDDNPEANIGIRMIMKLAKDVSYASTLNMNNLSIKI